MAILPKKKEKRKKQQKRDLRYLCGKKTLELAAGIYPTAKALANIYMEGTPLDHSSPRKPHATEYLRMLKPHPTASKV